jgi:hypothetical protein
VLCFSLVNHPHIKYNGNEANDDGEINFLTVTQNAQPNIYENDDRRVRIGELFNAFIVSHRIFNPRTENLSLIIISKLIFNSE